MKDTDYKGIDKLYHLLACLGLSIADTEAAIGAALAKEYDDKAKGSHWCWWDILADTLGIILGTTIRLVAIRLIYGYWRWNWFN